MGYDDIKELFRKLSQGTISEEGRTQLNEWMESNEEEGLSEIMDKDWSTFDQEEKLDQAPRWKADPRKVSSKQLNIYWKRRWAVAATILVLLTAGFALYWIEAGQEPRLVEQTNTEYRKQLVQLPDGTKVWLKQYSTISYWKPFQDKVRSCNLEGEAFFEVVTDSTLPFIVQSDFLRAKVLGTSFNIISGDHNLMPEVALAEGALEVSYINDAGTSEPVLLKPGEKLRVNTVNDEMIASAFIEDEPYAWKDDVLVFRKADVKEVARTLQAWYNITFTIETDSLYSGALVHRYDTKKLELEEVLNGISSVMPYNFRRQKNGSYIIKPKRIE